MAFLFIHLLLPRSTFFPLKTKPCPPYSLVEMRLGESSEEKKKERIEIVETQTSLVEMRLGKSSKKKKEIVEIVEKLTYSNLCFAI